MTIITGLVSDTARAWADVFGIPAPEIQEVRTTGLFRGKKEELRFRAARVSGTRFDFDLIEPVSGEPFLEYARTFGSGVHHLAMGCTEEEMRLLLNRAKEKLGIPELLSFDLSGTAYTVLDSREKLGTPLALYVRRP